MIPRHLLIEKGLVVGWYSGVTKGRFLPSSRLNNNRLPEGVFVDSFNEYIRRGESVVVGGWSGLLEGHFVIALHLLFRILLST